VQAFAPIGVRIVITAALAVINTLAGPKPLVMLKAKLDNLFGGGKAGLPLLQLETATGSHLPPPPINYLRKAIVNCSLSLLDCLP